MPEFIMEDSLNPDYLALPEFVQGYIECLFFTETSCIPMVEWHRPESQERVREGQADGEIPSDAGFGDLHPDTLADIKRDCERFQKEAEIPLSYAYQIAAGAPLYSEKQAGRDFWFTRNGHGVGFWDRGLGDIGEQLSELARGFGERNAWFSEQEEPDSPTGYGWVYLQ